MLLNKVGGRMTPPIQPLQLLSIATARSPWSQRLSTIPFHMFSVSLQPTVSMYLLAVFFRQFLLVPVLWANVFYIILWRVFLLVPLYAPGVVYGHFVLFFAVVEPVVPIPAYTPGGGLNAIQEDAEQEEKETSSRRSSQDKSAEPKWRPEMINEPAKLCEEDIVILSESSHQQSMFLPLSDWN